MLYVFKGKRIFDCSCQKGNGNKTPHFSSLKPLAFAIIKETDMNIDVVDISSSGPNMKYEDHRF